MTLEGSASPAKPPQLSPDGKEQEVQCASVVLPSLSIFISETSQMMYFYQADLVCPNTPKILAHSCYCNNLQTILSKQLQTNSKLHLLSLQTPPVK